MRVSILSIVWVIGNLSAVPEARTGALQIDSTNPLEVYEKKQGLPFNWGQLIMGTDLANELIEPLRLPRITVVTSDSSVVPGTSKVQYQVTNEHRRLPLLSDLLLKSNFEIHPDAPAPDIAAWHEFILENFPRVSKYFVGPANTMHSVLLFLVWVKI